MKIYDWNTNLRVFWLRSLLGIFCLSFLLFKDNEFIKDILSYMSEEDGFNPIYLLAVIGMILLFYRYGIIFICGEKKMTVWWGIILPLRKRTIDLTHYKNITINKTVIVPYVRKILRIHYYRNPYNSYRISISKQDDDIEIYNDLRNYKKAVIRASALADILSMGINDNTSKPEVKEEDLSYLG